MSKSKAKSKAESKAKSAVSKSAAKSKLAAKSKSAAKPKSAAKAPRGQSAARKPAAAKSKSSSGKAPLKAKAAASQPVVLHPPQAAEPANKTLTLILSRLDDMKAEQTVTIDLRGKSSITDYMVVTTGRANRHVGAIAENVAKGLKESGLKAPHIEGLPNCDWVLIDSGEVIVHVFRPEVREFYNLEKMWSPEQSFAKAR